MIGVVNYLVMMLGVEKVRRNIPGGLTFAELFSFMAISGHYLGFYLESLMLKVKGLDGFIAGNNNHNLVIFVPVCLATHRI